MSVLTIMTMVAVLPAIAEIATIGKTLYFMVIIDLIMAIIDVMTIIFIMAPLAVT